MLARREHSRAELAQKLIGKGADPDEVERTVADLEQVGLLSDARFARAFVTQMTGRYARRQIVYGMRERAVQPEAQATVDNELAEIDDAADARVLLERRFPEPPANDREKARQVRFLQSRGYALSLIFKLLRDRGAASDTPG
jgi:regulatory protein